MADFIAGLRCIITIIGVFMDLESGQTKEEIRGVEHPFTSGWSLQQLVSY